MKRTSEQKSNTSKKQHTWLSLLLPLLPFVVSLLHVASEKTVGRDKGKMVLVSGVQSLQL